MPFLGVFLSTCCVRELIRCDGPIWPRSPPLFFVTTDTPHSVGLLWTNDRLSAEIFT